jgi:hypothetical protein
MERNNDAGGGAGMKMRGCPFCGGKGAYVERLKHLDAPNPYRVRCGDCGGASGWASGEREAVALWSKRIGGGGCALRTGGTPMKGIERMKALKERRGYD